MTPTICNGCGNESPAWDQFCANCAKEVICQGCNRKYKRGQGLQDVDLCSRCLNEALEDKEEREEEEYCRNSGVVEPADVTEQIDPYIDYGFDHHWEFHDR